MSFLQVGLKSYVLGKNTNINVLLPDNVNPPFKTLYLLHGLSDDYSCWMRNTRIEKYAEKYNIAVVMPDADKSFYTDMKHGLNYYTYIAREVIEYTRKMFPLSDKREDTFIAGLSMGGYGAVKIALKNPDIFAAAATLSGALDIESILSGEDPARMALAYMIMGDYTDLSESDENVIYLAKRLAKSDKLKPAIYQAVGLEDYLYNDNQTFKNEVAPLWDNYKYEEDHGSHNWDFWDRFIVNAIEFMVK